MLTFPFLFHSIFLFSNQVSHPCPTSSLNFLNSKQQKPIKINKQIVNQIIKLEIQMRTENAGIRRNALIFAIITIILHIIACFMFGFYFKLPSNNSGDFVQAIFIAFAHGVFVVIGFGLLFSFLRKMLWTGMGFTLLITALTIQMYFMLNAFWTKTPVGWTTTTQTWFSQSDKTYSFFLINLIENQSYMATITGGFRCALANIIAFSSIMGRAGPLQAVFVVIFGTIGYELNRQLIQNYTNDSGGTNAIFVFGGFMSLAIGLLRHFSQRSEASSTKQHENYTANRASATFALMGTVLVWIFFPVLAIDYLNLDIASHTPYTGAYNVIFSLCAATITSFIVSPIFNNGILIRDIIYGPIAGGVACSTASYWILHPAYALVIGLVAAALQVIVMNVIEKTFARSKDIFHTFSFTLFGIQGLVGAIFAAIWNDVERYQAYGFIVNFNANQIFSWVASLISLPIGLIFGLLAGILCFIVGSHLKQDHFDDFTYWVNNDGIKLVTEETDPGIRHKSNIIKGKRAYL